MSDNKFSVSIHYDADKRGHLAYDVDTKEVEIVLPEEEWADKVNAYLTTAHTILNATGLDTYESKTIMPLDSLENLKLALTRMWAEIDVQVDWSRPVGM